MKNLPSSLTTKRKIVVEGTSILKIPDSPPPHPGYVFANVETIHKCPVLNLKRRNSGRQKSNLRSLDSQPRFLPLVLKKEKIYFHLFIVVARSRASRIANPSSQLVVVSHYQIRLNRRYRYGNLSQHQLC